jgi:uncharacterized phage protein gp47/JayE
LPWSTPTLAEVRGLVRDSVRAKLPGADALVPNSVLRVMSDSQGALCHATLQYVDWLALQLLPDTAETEWLDRHGHIWLVNSDGTTGRKVATLASGTVQFTGVSGTVVPVSTQLSGGSGVNYETTAEITIGAGPTNCPVRALDPGVLGNLDEGAFLSLISDVPGADSTITVVGITGGVDTENDNDLRTRILQRIQNPPMGGAAADYITWALAVPGVTRAWSYPNEMGTGTMTVRFLMDNLRASDDGWPQPADIAAVADYIDKMRPVTVKDCYVVAPIKQFLNITILDLLPADASGAVEASLRDMLFREAFPGQTIYTAWVSYAIMNAPGVVSFDLVTNTDYVMPGPGYMAVLGTILYQTSS